MKLRKTEKLHVKCLFYRYIRKCQISLSFICCYFNYICCKNIKNNQMKKVVIKLSVLVILLLAGIFCFYSSNSGNDSLKINALSIHNIEALASGENINYICIGNGDIDCHGMKVKLKVEGLNFNY